MKKTSKLKIAQSYAQALYQAADEAGLTDKVWKEVPVLKEAFSDTAQIRRLNDPLWSDARKKELISNVAEALELSPVSTNFLQVLAQNGHLADLSRVLDELTHIFYKKHNIKEVRVESVIPLSSAQSQKLGQGLAQIFGQKVALSYVINPALLGGLIIRADSVQIDDSLAGKLQRLEDVMKGNK